MKQTTFSDGFYRSVNCDCQAVIFVSGGRVRIFKGSTIVYHRPTVDGIDIDPEDEFSRLSKKSDLLCNEMVIDANAIEQIIRGRLDIINDYEFKSIKDATMALVGLDDAKPEDYWRPIF